MMWRLNFMRKHLNNDEGIVMGKIAIAIKDACKKFDGNEKFAVLNANLDIEEGNIVTILGTSGSGKTTLLKMINRLYEPTSGEIFFYGESVNDLPVTEYRRKIGYVIQQSGLFPHMTVEQNIAIVPKLLKWDKDKISERVQELLILMGLEPNTYRTRYPRQLSGGEQQRVGLARAMASDPSVMLMDEPFGAIDAITRGGLQDELKRIQSQLNKTILFVTHDIQEAFKLGDKVIIMDRGQVQQYDTPYNILFHPENEYVRKLIQTNTLYDKLKLLTVADIMHKDVVIESTNVIQSTIDLGEALTYMVRNKVTEAAVAQGTTIVAKISMDQIWDTVRPALQEV